jgi:hypothetical protein
LADGKLSDDLSQVLKVLSSVVQCTSSANRTQEVY